MPRFPFPRLPRGWFVVAQTAEIAAAAVQTVHYFGQDLVLYRGADGAARAVDPFCPHLGAHLGDACVEKDGLRCPFHGWRFDGGGRCVEIPYATGPIPRVGLRVWPSCEKDGLIFVWYDADGAPPDWTVPDALAGSWTESRAEPFSFASHPQDVMENSVDIAHVMALHRGRDARLVEPFQAHGARAVVRTRFLANGAGLGAPVDWLEIDITFALHGLGYLILDTRSPGSPVHGRTRFCTTPIDGERVRVLVVNNLEPLPDPALTRTVEDLFFAAALNDFRRDVRMWDRKAHLERPVLVRGDGPILAFRQWAAQFYRPFQASQSA